MSENYKRLDVVQQKIEDLLKKEAKLKKKEQKNQLTDEEEIDLEGVAELLKELKEDKKYWQEEVSKENKPEETSKSFGEADAEWIASVTGINYNYREWTAFTSELDETVIPSPGFQQAYENVSKALIEIIESFCFWWCWQEHARCKAGCNLLINFY